MARGKIVKTAPLPNAPGTEVIYYSNGHKGYRGGQGVRSPEAESTVDQGRDADPVEWNSRTMEGDAVTPSEVMDLERMLQNLRPEPEDYLGGPAQQGILPVKKEK
jgi:hypothetical protein